MKVTKDDPPKRVVMLHCIGCENVTPIDLCDVYPQGMTCSRCGSVNGPDNLLAYDLNDE